MPPKKTVSLTGIQKKKTENDMTVDEKYKKTLEELEALKDHIGVRKEYARRSHDASREWKDRMEKAQKNLEENQETHRAVGADMTRQYKAMQNDMTLRIHQLEAELSRTRYQLEKTEQELVTARNDYDKMLHEKEMAIEALTVKINAMCVQYETSFHDNMDKLIEKITQSKSKWEKQARSIQCQNKQKLLEFGLNPLEI